MHETPGLDGTEFDNRLRSLQKLLKETWKKIEYAFRIDTEHEIKKMETDLKKIKEGPFEDLRVYLKELQDPMDNEGVASMKEIYTRATFPRLLMFICWKRDRGLASTRKY